MKINKFKKLGAGRYKIIFDNTDITVYEDLILKYDLLIKKDIDVDLIDKIIEENNYYEAYHKALSYIEIKMRNKKEIIDYLKRKEYSNEIIYDVLNKLDKLGLLNDKKYITAFINDKTNLSNDGPYKIKKSLLDLDFDEKEIDDYLYTIDEDVWKNKLHKIVDKKKSLMKSKSYYMFITKMKNDLYNLGYDKDMIDNELSKISYESNALNKDYDKAVRKFKNDKIKITNSLLRKGYSYEEINPLFTK